MGRRREHVQHPARHRGVRPRNAGRRVTSVRTRSIQQNTKKMKLDEESVLAFHRGGKVALRMPHPVKTVEDLCLAYTPGVGKAVLHLDKKPEDAFDYTAKGKTVAVVSDGTAILGLGDRGPTAAIPVMEGKCVLFK
ncbi:MAG: hypothetical protein IJ783_08415, partial [Kiritimatiellae bacterium]|nr:hypothetical protein [Kiritimatiellia bacterium]